MRGKSFKSTTIRPQNVHGPLWSHWAFSLLPQGCIWTLKMAKINENGPEMGQLVLQFGQSTPKTTPNFARAGACCLASEMRQNCTILQPLREGSTLQIVWFLLCETQIRDFWAPPVRQQKLKAKTISKCTKIDCKTGLAGNTSGTGNLRLADWNWDWQTGTGIGKLALALASTSPRRSCSPENPRQTFSIDIHIYPCYFYVQCKRVQ